MNDHDRKIAIVDASATEAVAAFMPRVLDEFEAFRCLVDGAIVAINRVDHVAAAEVARGNDALRPFRGGLLEWREELAETLALVTAALARARARGRG